MRDARFLFVSAVVLVALVVTGCGGGGGGGGAAITGGTGILMTIGADAGGGGLGRSRDGVITAKLDAGAVIEAFDFATGTKLATGTIGADGKGTISLPASKTVVVTVTGTRDGKQYRLSLIIPSTTTGQTEYEADPATTMAAEAVAEKLGYAEGTVVAIDNKTWDDVVAAAEAYIVANPDPDMWIGGGLIETGKAFGAEGSINVEELGDVVDSVPETIDNDMVKAKNAVFQIKEAGVPFKTLLDEEIPDVGMVAEATGNAIDDAHLEQYAEKYRVLADRINDLIIPAVIGGFTTPPQQLGDPTGGLSIMDLELGKAYQVIGRENGLLMLEEIAGGEAGKVKIILVDGATTYALRGTPSAGDTVWTLVQTSSSDAQLNYSVAVNSGTAPTLNISLRDNDITTPLTFDGRATTVGPAGGPYTSITITGALSSAEVVANGTATLKFPEQPLGRVVIEENYPSEVDINLTNGTFRAGTISATASGSLVMMMTPVAISGLPSLPLPTEITLTNASLTVNADGHVSSVSGSGTIKTSYVETEEGMPDILPTEFTVTSFSASLDGGQVTATGSLSVKAVVPDKSGDIGEVLPTEATLNGTFTNNHNGTSFTGTLTGVWDNPSVDATPANVQGTVTAVGTLKRAHYEDFSLNLAVVADGEGTAALTINTLGWTNSNLTGAGAFAFDEDGNVTEATLTVTNQDDVQFVLDQDYSGTVSVGGTEVGTISQNGTAAQVHFTADGSNLYLFGVPEPV